MKTPTALQRSLLLATCLGLLSSCTRFPESARAYRYTPPPETGDGWQTASLQEKGLDPGPLLDLMDRLQQEAHLIHGLLIIKEGTLVFEEYFEGRDVNLLDEGFFRGDTLNFVERAFARDTLHFCASVTKSVTSQLLGIAVDRGAVESIETKTFSFFPDYADRSAGKEGISIRHMLTMTTGLPFDETSYPIVDPRNDARRLFFADDPIAFALGRDIAHEPGTTYEYNSATTVLLGEIIRRATGRSVPAFAEEHLFLPLQVSSYAWAAMPGAPEVTHAAGGLYLRPRDMAKLGQLMLQGGLWNGRRVLSADWVRRSVTEEVATSGLGVQRGYGFQWRIGRFGGYEAYWAAGWGGQYVVVLPDLDLVFVQTGGRYSGEHVPVSHVEIIEDHILPAVRGGTDRGQRGSSG